MSYIPRDRTAGEAIRKAKSFLCSGGLYRSLHKKTYRLTSWKICDGIVYCIRGSGYPDTFYRSVWLFFLLWKD